MKGGIPGNFQHRGNSDATSGYKFQGTSLRQLQSQRGRNSGATGGGGSNQRSASAPPASRQHQPMTPDSTRGGGGRLPLAKSEETIRNPICFHTFGSIFETQKWPI
jgi:hypothetical protein